jgi:tetratricopeptide (TPR) repeat protein
MFLIESHPSVALRHAQMALAYLKAGLGDRARTEAEKAVKLDPKSPAGYRTLGWVCQFNQIGVQFALGLDLDCAINAYKKAVELDPDDSDTALSLAYLYELGPDGERYGGGARLIGAIAAYRAVKQKDKSVGEQYDDNVLYDLLYSGRYDESLVELGKLPSSAARNALSISAVVAQAGGTKGVDAGIDRANHLFAGAEQRNSALATAGSELIRLRLYPEAAGILTAAAEGQQNAAGIAQQIAIFRQLQPYKGEYLPDSDPRSIVQRMYMTYLSGRFDENSANRLFARHAYASDDEWQRNIHRSEQARGILRLASARTGMTSAVLLDVFAANLKIKSTGDDESGYRITLDTLGSKSRHYFVVREKEGYRVVTDGITPSEAGNEVLYLLKSGQEKCARSLLDWMRDQMHRGGGDDQLSGPLFPRFWTTGDTGDAASMRLAAAALVATDKDAIADLIPEVRSAWEKASTDETRLNFSLLLANAYRAAQDGAHLKEIGTEVLRKNPDSYTAIDLAARADSLLKNWDDWKQMLDAQLAKHPDDDALLRMKAGLDEDRGDWAAARAVRQEIADKGKGTAEDYNMYGWTGLFDGKVDEDIIKAARQATMLTNNASFAELHTLACLYAYQGKTVEARDLLLKAMTAGNMSLPNPEVWFGFGSIYEQYGINDAALEAYSKVEKPVGWIGPSSTYVLAQSRIKSLNAGQANHGPASAAVSR